MPDLEWNQALWNGTYDWSTSGEEWSFGWGGSEAQWFGSLYPRLHRWLPCANIAEIAPGFGRWTKFLIPLSTRYAGVDISDQCIQFCREKFSQTKNRSFYRNDGMSLTALADNEWDLIFSFDSLVHVEMDIMAEYIHQIVKKLRPGGVAFIHHSNFLGCEPHVQNVHQRATSVSAELIRRKIEEGGGTILVQEIINWGGEIAHDALTLFGHKHLQDTISPKIFQNLQFMQEANLIREYQSHYSGLDTVSITKPMSQHRKQSARQSLANLRLLHRPKKRIKNVLKRLRSALDWLKN